MWATAWWDKWFTPDVLQQAFAEASIKVACSDKSWWGRTAGPVAAFVATMNRIGWVLPSAREIIDDNGTSWFFDLDSPAAVGKACQDAVRRWRLDRLGKALPGLVPHPHCPDVPCQFKDQPTRLIDFSYILAPLVAGTGRGSRVTEQWNPLWKGDLASAASNGQWTQLRRAQVPAWKIEDKQCQLCHDALGTIEHRFECRTTVPDGGWPCPPKKAELAVRTLSAYRLRLLRTRGILVLRVPVHRPKQSGEFLWLLEPNLNDPAISDAIWYFDGSMLNGKWLPIRATGFGIAIVSAAGKLLGCGRGTPPHWCSTAAAAEAWALQFVLLLVPFPPQMRTDCQALLATLQQPVQNATAASRQLARIWVTVASALGGCFKSFAGANQLVWMPAHTGTSSVGEVKLSNGVRLSMVDWRANRLVDALAKMSAFEAQCIPAALKLIASSDEAVRYAAQLLGRVTHAANHHKVAIMDDKGNVMHKICRDAMEAPKRPKRRLTPDTRNGKPSEAASKTVARSVEAKILAPIKAQRTSTAPQAYARRAKQLAEEQLERRVGEIGASLTTPPGRPQANDRLKALRRRVGLLPDTPA